MEEDSGGRSKRKMRLKDFILLGTIISITTIAIAFGFIYSTVITYDKISNQDSDIEKVRELNRKLTNTKTLGEIAAEEAKEESKEEPKEEVEDTAAGYESEFAVNLLKNYKPGDEIYIRNKNPEYEYDEYLLTDIDKDDSIECLHFESGYLYIYKEVDGKISIINQFSVNDYSNPSFYLVENIETGEKVLFMEGHGGDGFCYEYYQLSELVVDGTNYSVTSPLYYSCNSAEEDRLRSSIEANSEGLTEEELEKKLYEAHTLQYGSYGKQISKEKFESIKKELPNKYKLIVKNNEDSTLFN